MLMLLAVVALWFQAVDQHADYLSWFGFCSCTFMSYAAWHHQYLKVEVEVIQRCTVCLYFACVVRTVHCTTSLLYQFKTGMVYS
jgi:hypothetical protein